MICTFFGHRDTPQSVKSSLHTALTDLINKGVDTFYVGNNGSFDLMVCETLYELSEKYAINYYIVLCRLPEKSQNSNKRTILPEGIERVPPRFAIDHRNKWMVGKTDFVITYVKRPWGGAAKFKELAEKKGKVVINLP